MTIDDTLSKLDSIWTVQLFFRTFPYYLKRANTKIDSRSEKFDIVVSENPPAVNLPDEIKKQLDFSTIHLWAMSIIYIEAILEDYIFTVIENLGLKSNRLPRQADKLFVYLNNEILSKKNIILNVDCENEWQLGELTQTRHLWVHRGGIVDQHYLEKTENWWMSRPTYWFENKPIEDTERLLTEEYIKGNIYFSKKLVSQIHRTLEEHLA